MLSRVSKRVEIEKISPHAKLDVGGGTRARRHEGGGDGREGQVESWISVE